MRLNIGVTTQYWWTTYRARMRLNIGGLLLEVGGIHRAQALSG